jgi:hypothetical protein
MPSLTVPRCGNDRLMAPDDDPTADSVNADPLGTDPLADPFTDPLADSAEDTEAMEATTALIVFGEQGYWDL